MPHLSITIYRLTLFVDGSMLQDVESLESCRVFENRPKNYRILLLYNDLTHARTRRH